MEVDPPQGQGAAADAAEGAPKPAQQQLESTEQQTQGEAGVSGSGEADADAEMVDPPVNGEHLVEMEGMGFPRARAYRALALSGTTTVEGAVNWLVEHSDDADIDEPPPKIRRADAEAKLAKANKPKLTPEEAKEQAAKILAEAKKRREKEEKEQAKARGIAMRESAKEMNKARGELDEAERRRNLIERQRAKDEEAAAREKIRAKIAQDRAERRAKLGLPAELTAEEKAKEAEELRLKAEAEERRRAAFVPVKPAKRLVELREKLRAMRQAHLEGDAFTTCIATLLKLLGNVARSPGEEKYRRVKLSNAAIQKRIVAVTNGVDFLEGCGFEHATEGGEEVILMDEAKVNMELLNGAGSLLVGARDNPTFGML